MTAVEVVGGGAVAQLLCRDLLQRGCAVQLSLPQRNRTDQQQRQCLSELAALPWLQGVDLGGDAEPAPLRLFAGTVEQWFDYQNSSAHGSAVSPVLLLTSWWQTLDSLQEQLQGTVLPVYPRIAVESWQGRLAVLGKLQLELPTEGVAPGLDRSTLQRKLDQLGLNWQERPMQTRFKALFARTTFAYWYLLTALEPKRRGEPGVARETILAQWQRLEPLVAREADLQLSLEMLELSLAVMRNGDPLRNDAAWILQVLIEHKRRKMDYFLERQLRVQ